jgi:hypothetical protein
VGLISLFSYLISQHHSAFYQPCVTPAFQKSFFYVLWTAFSAFSPLAVIHWSSASFQIYTWCGTNRFCGIFKEVEPFGRSFLLNMNFFLCLELHQGCSLSQRSGQCSMALCFWSLPGDNVSVSSVLSFHLNVGRYCGDKQEDALQTCGKHGIDLHHIEK